MLFWRKSKYLYVKNIHKIKKCVRKNRTSSKSPCNWFYFQYFHIILLSTGDTSHLLNIYYWYLLYIFIIFFLFQQFQSSSSIYKHTMWKNLNYRRFIYFKLFTKYFNKFKRGTQLCRIKMRCAMNVRTPALSRMTPIIARLVQSAFIYSISESHFVFKKTYIYFHWYM
jgi:hypothetical protein